jgi:hypothetical protein
MWELYKTQPSFILGFHGCDESVGRAVIAGEHHLDPSQNEYDWLGNGRYFWEGSPHRTWEWAQSVHKRRPQVVRKPFVLGAVIEFMHQLRSQAPASGHALPTYDTVRGPFLEGEDLYPGSGIKALAHVQVAVRNVACIKGYFLPIRSA